MITRRLACSLFLITALFVGGGTASAEVPTSITHQGRLLDDSGEPVEGNTTLTFTLYDSSSGGSILWQTEKSVEIDKSGFYSVELGGSGNAITSSILQSGEVWLGIKVDGSAELQPRVQLHSVPYAIESGSVSAGAVTTEALADGAVSEDALADGSVTSSKVGAVSWGVLSGVPDGLNDGDDDTVGGLSCTEGQIARYDGSQWNCTEVGATIGGLSCSSGQIAEFDGSNWNCATKSVAWSNVQNVPSAFEDGVDDDALGDLNCGSGEIAEFDGSNWNCTPRNAPQLGETRDNPAANCAALLDSRPSATSGIYWLKPSSASAAFQTYCDMDADGGGWTLVWSNLRGGRNKPTFELAWGAAIHTLPRVAGQLVGDLESFVIYTGLAHWDSLSPNDQIRYDWKPDYDANLDQRYRCEYNLEANNDYRITFQNCSQLVGNRVPGLVNRHEGERFSTYDNDNDSSNNHCSRQYGDTPWWYESCWSGNINGGGAFRHGDGQRNGAYWVSAANSWGSAGGDGAGNGWIFVK